MIKSSLLAPAALLAALAGCNTEAPQPASTVTVTVTPSPTPEPTTSDSVHAHQIAEALEANGFKVSKLKASPGGYVEEVGGASHDVTIEGLDSGINVFPNHEALAMWVQLSKSFGGIAVTGDVWAISLSSDAEDRKASKALADKIAPVMGGTVAV